MKRESKLSLYRRNQAVPCAHCGTGVVTRPKGLCWKCYYTPGVRELYGGSTHHGATRSPVVDRTGASHPPAEPITAPSGSLARVEELERRALRGESLFGHPDDADWEAWIGREPDGEEKPA